MISALTTAISALRAFGQKTSTTAHNLANVNTAGFSAHTTRLQEDVHGGVRAKTVEAAPPLSPPVSAPHTELSHVDLPTEMTNLVLAKRGYEANIKAAQVAAETEDSALDLVR